MDEHKWLAERFEAHRTHLRAVARLVRSSGCHCLHGKSRARPVLDAGAVDAVVSIASCSSRSARDSPRPQLAPVEYVTMLVPFSGSSRGACSSTSSMTSFRAPEMCRWL